MSIIEFPVDGERDAFLREERIEGEWVYTANCERCGYASGRLGSLANARRCVRGHVKTVKHRTGQESPRDQAQTLRALAVANEVRLRRAALRRELKGMRFPEGERRLAEIIRDPPPEYESLRVGRAILMLHRWGRSHMVTALRATPVAEDKELRALTPRQREAIASRLLVKW